MDDIAILSDTHIPSRAQRLPPWVEGAVADADIVLHAGDFDSHEAYDHVESIAERLIAVKGNTDPELGIPEVTDITVEGLTFVVTHGTGPIAGYQQRLRSLLHEHGGETVVLVAGHTHDPTDTWLDGHRFINPRSATGVNPADHTSMVVGTVDGDVLDVSFRTS